MLLPVKWIILISVVVLICEAITAGASESILDADQPIVTTSYGQLRGKIIDTARGHQCNAFLGVPFAAPPTGDLRWQKPQEPKNWPDVRNATESGAKCIQLGSNGTDSNESEDCLFLNIFAPMNATSTKLPVMVFIHGGAFVLGSAQDYGQEGPCENLASRGVVLVVLQYRLFMYGFFSSGDNVALGNYGLWDQIEALKWVQKNIASFGGDPNKVTLFGESAGAASVSYLTYTTQAKDLFHQSLAESGSVYSYWAPMNDVSVTTAKQVAKAAKCNDMNSEAYVKCLRQLQTIQLQQVYNLIPGIFNPEFYLVWSVRVDGELYTSAKLTELGTKRPAIIGVNSMEMPMPDPKAIHTAGTVLNMTLSLALPENETTLNSVLRQTAEYVYIDSKGDRNDDKFVYEQALKMQADIDFHAAAGQEAILKQAAGSPLWVYNFDFWSDNVFPADYPFKKGAPHGHELCYLFRMVTDDPFLGCPTSYQGENGTVADYMGEMWTNFAITGDPSHKDLAWPNFHSLTNASAMTMRVNLSIDPHFSLDVTNFWYNLKPSIEMQFQNENKNDTQPCGGNGSEKVTLAPALLLFIAALKFFW